MRQSITNEIMVALRWWRSSLKAEVADGQKIERKRKNCKTVTVEDVKSVDRQRPHIRTGYRPETVSSWDCISTIIRLVFGPLSMHY